MKKLSCVAALLAFVVAAPSVAQDLQQKDVDQFVKSTPAVLAVVAAIDQDMSKEEKQQMQQGQFKLRPYTTMASLVKDKPAQGMLDAVTKQVGYSGFGDYAQTADRFFSVAFSAKWIEETAGGLEKNPEKIANLFHYLEDKSKPAAKRERLEKNFKQFCQDRCVNAEDIGIVSENYEQISKALKIK